MFLKHLYRVEKVLRNSNYVLQKIGTNFTQCVHSFCDRSVTTKKVDGNLEQMKPQKTEPDPRLTKYRNGPKMFDDHLKTLIDDT